MTRLDEQASSATSAAVRVSAILALGLLILAGMYLSLLWTWTEQAPPLEVRNAAMSRVIAGFAVPGVELGPVEQREMCPVTSRTPVHTDDLEFYRPVTAMENATDFRQAAVNEFHRRGWKVDAAGSNVTARVEDGDVELTVVASTETPGNEGIYVWYSGPGKCRPGL